MASAPDFLSLLERRSAEGAPMAAWIEDPDGLARAARLGGDAFHDALNRAADATLPKGALLREDTIAAAVLGATGQILAHDARFDAWFGASVIDGAIVARLAGSGGIAHHLHVDEGGRPSLFAYGHRDAAARWLLPAPLRSALDSDAARVVILGVAPSRSGRLQREVARAFGLSSLEARIIAALVETGRLPEAARDLGIPYATAREAMAQALKRTGARRQADLVARVVGLSAGIWRRHTDPAQLLVDAYGLTPRQGAIAVRLTDGLTRAQVARALKVSEAVVKDDLTRVFARLHVSSAPDLARIVTETAALAALTSITGGEFSLPQEGTEPLRFVARPEARGGGWIAVSDYGPRSGEPVLVFHAGAASRHVARRLVTALQKAGYRPIALDRPGFGLSDPLHGPAYRADPFAVAAHDVLDVMDRLEVPRARILARGGGRVALALARLAPERLTRVVCLNPDTPMHRDTRDQGLLGAVKAAIIARPQAIATLARLMLGQTSLALIEQTLRVALAKSPRDLAVFDDPAELADYARSVRLLSAGNIEGFVAEQAVHASGGTPAPLQTGTNWTFVSGTADPLYEPSESLAHWQTLAPGSAVVRLEGAGRFPHLTHTDAVVAALQG